jgi:UDPglucose 6-dehydrogenase
VVHCGIGEASLVKYSINTFLATKVIYMNELALLAETHGYEWYDIARMINLDDRIGVSHMMVPGPDGTFGFGGMCFPKDTAALKKFSNDLNIDMSLLTAAIESNNRIRSK